MWLTGCSRPEPTTLPPSPPQKANPPLTQTQSLGIELTKMLANDSRLVGAQISVGTDASTVTLDGKVPTARAKHVASQITQKKALRFKILNRLVVTKGNSN
ncbi:hypothetical protein IAD21_06427 (plasmid) [Abditibacteriota bacterium]|nr:hypothetical protein IAD21_06427 [Abditibacteriota bacterium]